MSKLIIAAFVITSLPACTPMNKDEVKLVAEEQWKTIGFKAVGYEGFQWGFNGIGGYGGAKVWHRLRMIPDNGISYTGYIQKWGDEYHFYGPEATDAIKP